MLLISSTVLDKSHYKYNALVFLFVRFHTKAKTFLKVQYLILDLKQFNGYYTYSTNGSFELFISLA